MRARVTTRLQFVGLWRVFKPRVFTNIWLAPRLTGSQGFAFDANVFFLGFSAAFVHSWRATVKEQKLSVLFLRLKLPKFSFERKKTPNSIFRDHETVEEGRTKKFRYFVDDVMAKFLDQREPFVMVNLISAKIATRSFHANAIGTVENANFWRSKKNFEIKRKNNRKITRRFLGTKGIIGSDYGRERRCYKCHVKVIHREPSAAGAAAAMSEDHDDHGNANELISKNSHGSLRARTLVIPRCRGRYRYRIISCCCYLRTFFSSAVFYLFPPTLPSFFESLSTSVKLRVH